MEIRERRGGERERDISHMILASMFEGWGLRVEREKYLSTSYVLCGGH